MPTSGYKDYFKILGVERNADSDLIKRAFRKLARQYHPDVNPGDKAAESKFKEISEAYEVLSDKEKRTRYEQFGRYWSQPEASGGRSSAGSGFDVDFGNYGNFDEFITDLLGRFGSSNGVAGFSGMGSGFPAGSGSSRTPLNLDAEIKLKIGFAEAFRGTERTLSVNQERVQVRIPKGVTNGSKLRLRGKGNLQPGTGRRGDLYLILDVQPHSIWNLDKENLRATLPVSLDELVLGGTVKVMTPDGEAELAIPAGTQPGKSLRLKGKGWPFGDGRGDLFLTIEIKFPEKWSFDEQQLFTQLREVRSNDPRESWLEAARL